MIRDVGRSSDGPHLNPKRLLQSLPKCLHGVRALSIITEKMPFYLAHEIYRRPEIENSQYRSALSCTVKVERVCILRNAKKEIVYLFLDNLYQEWRFIKAVNFYSRCLRRNEVK